MRSLISFIAVLFAFASVGAEDKRVTVLVELESPSILEAFDEAAEADFDMQASVIQAEHASFLGALQAREMNVSVRHQFSKVWNGVTLKIAEDEIDQIRDMPHVKRVWPNGKVSIPENKEMFFGPEGDEPAKMMPSLNVQEVWKKHGLSGKDITIAIHDTGIDYTHPDLGGCLGPKCKVIGGYDIINEDKDPMDDHFHGTHVAAIAAGDGKKMGVAPKAKLLGYKVLSKSGGGSWEGVLRGIEMSVDPNGDGKFDDAPDVMNFSLGGAGSPLTPLGRAVDAASKFTILVMAAGNSGPKSKVGMPAGAQGSIAVGATDEAKAMAAFSSNGPTEILTMKPDISAPGVKIWSATLKGKYRTASGTSMASPFAAGLVALMLEKYPLIKKSYNRSNIVRSMLSTSAKPFKLKETSLLNSYFRQGHGLVDPMGVMEQKFALAYNPGLMGPNHPDMGPHDLSQSHLARSLQVPLNFIGKGMSAPTKDNPYQVAIEHDFGDGVELDFFPKEITKKYVNLKVRVRQKTSVLGVNRAYPHAKGAVLTVTNGKESLRVPLSVFPLAKFVVKLPAEDLFSNLYLRSLDPNGTSKYWFPRWLPVTGDTKVAQAFMLPGKFSLQGLGNTKTAYNVWIKPEIDLQTSHVETIDAKGLSHSVTASFVDEDGGAPASPRVSFALLTKPYPVSGYMRLHNTVRMNPEAAKTDLIYSANWTNGDIAYFSGGKAPAKGGKVTFPTDGYAAVDLAPKGATWPGMFCQRFSLRIGKRAVGYGFSQNLAHRTRVAKGEFAKYANLRLTATGPFSPTTSCNEFGASSVNVVFANNQPMRGTPSGVDLWPYGNSIEIGGETARGAVPTGSVRVYNGYFSTTLTSAAYANGAFGALGMSYKLVDGTGKVVQEGVSSKKKTWLGLKLAKGKYTLSRWIENGIKTDLEFEMVEEKKSISMPAITYFDRRAEKTKTQVYFGVSVGEPKLEARVAGTNKWNAVKINAVKGSKVDFLGEVDAAEAGQEFRLTITDKAGNVLTVTPAS